MLYYDRPLLTAELKRDEGYSNVLYFDDLGFLTVGYGHCLGSRPVDAQTRAQMLATGIMDKPWPHEVLELQFKIDCEAHEIELERVAQQHHVRLDELPDAVVRALMNMCFNLGGEGLSKFRKMWAALTIGNRREAAAQALDSTWAGQVGPRAIRIAELIRGY